MKAIILVLGLLPTLVFAETPSYATNPELAAGAYTAIKQYDCRDGISECEEAEIFLKNKKPFIRMGMKDEYSGDKRVMPLLKTATGALVFSKTFNDDCDNNGCVNIDKISGVVYARKVGAKYVPSIKATLETTCGWGDDEACPHGLQEKTEVRLSR